MWAADKKLIINELDPCKHAALHIILASKGEWSCCGWPPLYWIYSVSQSCTIKAFMCHRMFMN